MAEPITEYVPTPHAAAQMQRRRISETVVAEVMRAPEQRAPVRPGREVLQSRKNVGGKIYLVRVFVDVDRTPAEVVTVYRTRNVEKYRR